MASNLVADHLFSVDGMVAVITGGGTGIGLMMTRALVANGAAKVFILGRRIEPLQEAAKEKPSVIIPIQCDVTSKESLQKAVDQITSETGFVNLVIANSGVLGPLNRWEPQLSLAEARKKMFDDLSMEDMTHTLHVNTTAAFFTMTAFLELLDAGNKNALKGGFGKPITPGSDVPSVQSQVIFTSSVGAFSRHAASTPAYSGSKAALAHLTKHSSANLAKYGIRVNALAPGLFPSELASSLIGARDPGKEAPTDDKFIPSRRFGGAEEMGGAVLYLASRAGSFTNGAILLNDGGRASVMPASY